MARRFISLALLLLACAGSLASAATSPEPSAARDQLTRLAPDASEAKPQGPPAFYGPENLYQYMNGGADIFVLYDVQTLFHQEYVSGEAEITADIFDMGSPANAFGIYAAERSPTYQFITLGAEGYRNEGILNFLQDRYYVKLAAFGPGADAALDVVARGLSRKIGANPAFPALLEQLPKANRKPRSEQYMPKDPLGHGFLSPAYVIDYRYGDQESKLLVSVAPDADQAGQRLAQLEKHFRSSGECSPAPELGEGAIRAGNSYEGKIVARIQGRYLVMVLNPVDGGAELLKEATKSLP